MFAIFAQAQTNLLRRTFRINQRTSLLFDEFIVSHSSMTSALVYSITDVITATTDWVFEIERINHAPVCASGRCCQVSLCVFQPHHVNSFVRLCSLHVQLFSWEVAATPSACDAPPTCTFFRFRNRNIKIIGRSRDPLVISCSVIPPFHESRRSRRD